MEALSATFAPPLTAVTGGDVERSILLTAGAAAGASAGGPGGGSGGGGLLSSAPGSVGELALGDILTGGLTAFSALSSIQGGEAAAAALETSQQFEEFGATQEIIKGRRAALDILEAVNETIEGNIVNTAASGIQGSGSPFAASQAAQKKGSFEVGIARDDAVINAGARKAKADQLGLEADAATTKGIGDAAGTVAGLLIRRGRRGSVA